MCMHFIGGSVAVHDCHIMIVVCNFKAYFYSMECSCLLITLTLLTQIHFIIVI